MVQNDIMAKLTRLAQMGSLELQGLAEQAAMQGAPPPMDPVQGVGGNSQQTGFAEFVGPPEAPPPAKPPYAGGLNPAQLAALPQKPRTQYAPAPSIRQAPQVQVSPVSSGAAQRPQTLGQIIRG